MQDLRTPFSEILKFFRGKLVCPPYPPPPRFLCVDPRKRTGRRATGLPCAFSCGKILAMLRAAARHLPRAISPPFEATAAVAWQATRVSCVSITLGNGAGRRLAPRPLAWGGSAGAGEGRRQVSSHRHSAMYEKIRMAPGNENTSAKVLKALAEIDRILDIMEPGTLALSFNGGKDACAMMHLVSKLGMPPSLYPMPNTLSSTVLLPPLDCTRPPHLFSTHTPCSAKCWVGGVFRGL